MFIDQNFLIAFGWSELFKQSFAFSEFPDCIPARVIAEERGLYRVQWGFETSGWAAISGKMQFQASERKDFPAVGDWVLIQTSGSSDKAMIHQIGARKSIIYRKQSGTSADMQILSTNVDYTFITTSINEDLSYRRLERYLAMALDSGTSPVILLTKVDLFNEKLENIKTDMGANFPGVPYHFLSKNEFEKADFFKTYLKLGNTTVIIGSSGVGKSTLVNFLVGQEKAKIQEIRGDDGKGRHTTTSRNLYITRFGGMVIDTPGMRELSLSDQAEGLVEQFDDIIQLAAQCRFGDCKHQTEPDCAIKEALRSESLDKVRWESYLKLESEVHHNTIKQNKSLAAVERRKWKKLSDDGRQKAQLKREKK